jgi:hypothetical protein
MSAAPALLWIVSDAMRVRSAVNPSPAFRAAAIMAEIRGDMVMEMNIHSVL